MLKVHLSEVLCLCFNAHNQSFITAGNDKTIHVWSISSYHLLAKLEGHAEPVTCLALDGNFLLSGSEDGKAYLWDLQSKQQVQTLEGHSDVVLGVACELEFRAARFLASVSPHHKGKRLTFNGWWQSAWSTWQRAAATPWQ